MIRHYKLQDGRIIDDAAGTGSILICSRPDEKERRFLIEELFIDEHTLNSALDPDELSRLEFEPAHTAMIFKKPKNYSSEDEFLFKVISMGVFLFEDRLVVVLPDETNLFDGGKLFTTANCLHDVFLRLIYRTIYHYVDHLKVVNMVSESLEQKINTSMDNKYLINLFSLEKSLVYYLNAINSNSMVINRLQHNAKRIGFSQENTELLEDIIIENNQCYRLAEIYSNILASLMDARVSVVSNNLNVLMKTLNIITIAIMVPTFVVSAFSMNVKIPFAQIPNAFWIIMGLAMCSVIGFFLFWRFKKW
jgi:magnesium transporter